MRSLFSLFTKNKSKFVPKESSNAQKLKLKRNIVEHKIYINEKAKNKFDLKFATDFIIDAQSKSIPISKLIIKGDYKSAASVYSKIISKYKKYLLDSKISEKYIENFINRFKQLLFRNLLSIIKKEVSKKVILKQSVLSKSKLNEIKLIENKLIKDLYNLGFITDIRKINIRFSELNSFESISNSNVFDENPIELFKHISNIYSSLKKGERSPSVNELVKGWSKIETSKNRLHINNLIVVNTYSKQANLNIIHELIHSYLKREHHVYGRNEVVVEFLTSLLADKYFKEYNRREPSKNLEKNQYFIGDLLYRLYKDRYNLDLSYVNQYLLSNKDYIKQHTIKK